MSTARQFKYLDDEQSAVDNGTPFKVQFFVGQREKSLFFKTRIEAFEWVQNHPTAEHPEIKDLANHSIIFPT